jgi:hypothetical protein
MAYLMPLTLIFRIDLTDSEAELFGLVNAEYWE